MIESLMLHSTSTIKEIVEQRYQRCVTDVSHALFEQQHPTIALMGSLDSHIHVDCFQSFDIFVALSVIFFAPTTANTDFWKLISYADF